LVPGCGRAVLPAVAASCLAYSGSAKDYEAMPGAHNLQHSGTNSFDKIAAEPGSALRDLLGTADALGWPIAWVMADAGHEQVAS